MQVTFDVLYANCFLLITVKVLWRVRDGDGTQVRVLLEAPNLSPPHRQTGGRMAAVF